MILSDDHGRHRPCRSTIYRRSIRPAPRVVSLSCFTASDRFRWVVLTTIGPKNLAAGVVVSGINTWRDQPEDYSTHWDGFAHRYVNRLAAGGTSHVFEAGFGSLWGEDPRYFRAAGQPLRTRFGHVVKSAFVTHNRNGDPQPRLRALYRGARRYSSVQHLAAGFAFDNRPRFSTNRPGLHEPHYRQRLL